MPYITWVEIDLDALAANVALLRGIVGPSRKILMVVKADAYGHGAVEVSRLAERAGVDFLGVATLHEGVEIRRAGVRLPILILSPSLPEEAPQIVAHELRAVVSSRDLALALGQAARQRGVSAAVHVEVDTGMGRAGVSIEEAAPLLREMSELGGIRLEGLCTHFPSAEGGNQTFTGEQTARFRELLAEVRGAGIEIPIAHAANSGAILGAPESWLDMVRPGLLLYGLAPQPGMPETRPFQPVMGFKTRVVHLRWMEAGSNVSYGRSCLLERRTMVATVGAGYGHGVPWKLSNRGEILVRGSRARILGRVTMDLTMVDVTEIPGVAVGDEAVLFGTQGGESLSAHEVAGWAETLVYEVICGLGKRVVRTYRYNGRPAKALTLVGEETL